MRTFLATAILAMFLAPAALAGGGDWPPEQHQQMAAPQTKVVVVPSNTGGGNDNSWLVPVSVAVVGAVGVIGAAYVNRRKD